MALIYCGIDEAGYGPLLGPLCVGATVFRVDAWNEGDEAPNLWKVLERGVCRDGNDKQRRVAVDDSKKLKLANNSQTRHPLHHLERGVLAFLSVMEDPGRGGLPASDIELFRALCASRCAEAWYAGEPIPSPIGLTPGEISIAANLLRVAIEDSGVSVLGMWGEAVSEDNFNQIMEAAGTKAAVTESVIVKYLSEAWRRYAAVGVGGNGDGVRVVCDRQGGRTQYAEYLARMFPEAMVTIIGETQTQSVYDIEGGGSDGSARKMRVAFKTEAESAHLPVALASMLAKLTREMMMARFNRYWCGRIPELKPTAGYALDARRWLRDVESIISPQERRALVRRA